MDPGETPSHGGDHALFGWRVRSDIALPELPAWSGDERAPDLVIHLGAVPPLGPEALTFSPAITMREGVLRLDIPDVARYRLEDGARVVIDPVMAATSADVRLFLFGTILSALCYQRGLVPLHAAAIDVGGRALLLAGPSGLGKSTLAAALVGRGYRLLSDDVCALDAPAGAGPVIRPSFPRLKLWADAARHLGVPTTGLEQARVEQDKFLVPADAFRDTPLPPAHLVILARAFLDAEVGRTRLTAVEALQRTAAIHRWRLGAALVGQPAIFTAWSALIRTTPTTLLRRLDDLSALSRLADQVLDLAQGIGP